MDIVLVVILVVQAIVCDFIAGFVAGEKGYSSESWGAIGFFFGIFGLIGAAGLPVKQKEAVSKMGESGLLKKCYSCFEIIKIEARTCRYCGHKFSDKSVAEEIRRQLEECTDREIKMAFGSLKTLPPEHMLPVLYIMAEILCQEKQEYEITNEYKSLFKEIVDRMLEIDREGSIARLEELLVNPKMNSKVKMILEALAGTKNISSVPLLLEKMSDYGFSDLIFQTLVKFGPEVIPYIERYEQGLTDKSEKKSMAKLIKTIQKRAADQ